VSSEGKIVMSKLKLALLAAASACAAPGLAHAQEVATAAVLAPAPKAQAVAGHAMWVVGEVERVGADGRSKRLAKGDAVYEGDVIRSASGSHAQLVMSDEALLAVRAETSVKLAKYSYHGVEDGSERAVIELLRGGVRSITGAIGRTNKHNYELKNEMHVIGIRGTDHETFATSEGTFNRVTLGGTYLQGAGGRVDLAPGEVGFASLRSASAPVRLEGTPDFMHLAAYTRGSRPQRGAPRLRGPAEGDERRLHQSAVSASVAASARPVMPVQALRETPAWGQLKDKDKNKLK
jgi:hypothetical protein